jgi:hypothetical protein
MHRAGRLRSLFLALLFLPLQPAPLLAQTAPPPDTSSVTCGERPSGSRTVRSDILVSPDGKHRAYAQVEANAIPPDKAGPSAPSCVNRSGLYASASGADFTLVFLQEPGDMESGDSLRLVDWSPDGRWLLMELALWQYDSPGMNRGVLVYDSRYGTFQQPDMSRIYNKIFGNDCSLNLHVEGFTAQGKVVLSTQPLTAEEEEVLATPSCSRKKATWQMDLASETLTAVAPLTKVEHYAKIEPAPAK